MSVHTPHSFAPNPPLPRPTEDGLAALLHILRLQIQSFAQPERHGWMRGLVEAKQIWGQEQGPLIFAALADALGQMRRARKSAFGHANPDCPRCARTLTPHEGQFLQILRFFRAEAPEKAALTAYLLCEANPCDGFLRAARTLVQIAPSDLPGAARP